MARNAEEINAAQDMLVERLRFAGDAINALTEAAHHSGGDLQLAATAMRALYDALSVAARLALDGIGGGL